MIVNAIIPFTFVFLCLSCLLVLLLEYKSYDLKNMYSYKKMYPKMVFVKEKEIGLQHQAMLQKQLNSLKIISNLKNPKQTKQDLTMMGWQKNLNISILNKKLDEHLRDAQKEIGIVIWGAPWNPPDRTPLRFYHFNSTECGACHFTYNRTMINMPDVKAVVFHYRDIVNGKLPDRRRPDQYYIFWIMESAANNKQTLFDHHDGAFNMTMSHRENSDIFSPYGSAVEAIKLIQNNPNRNSIDRLVEKKTSLALWIVSNCFRTKGARRRMRLALSLIAVGLQLDLGGDCFPYGVRALPQKNFAEKYKFYLSFENSYHCQGYITEKFFKNALQFGAVPVVFGACKQDYVALAPPNSFIFAEDYTAQELVAYLKYLDQNNTAYREYLEWREIDVSELPYNRRANTFCQLCRMLHGIHYDQIFKSDYNGTSKYPLFEKRPGKRIIKSLSHWYFDTENFDCFDLRI